MTGEQDYRAAVHAIKQALDRCDAARDSAELAADLAWRLDEDGFVIVKKDES